MKRSGFDHPKINGRLCKLLGIRKYAAIGLVESLWHFTAKHSPAGDVGKWSDEEIAESMDWDRGPAELIENLVEAKLLDRSADHRLLIHDWPEHCDDAIHMMLARKRVFFADGTKPKLSRIGGPERKELEAHYKLAKPASRAHRNARRAHKNALPEPSLALPSLAMPSPALDPCSESAEPPSEPPVDEVAILIPCSGALDPVFPVPESKVAEWSASYPAVDVMAELRKARQWSLDNPQKQKTYGGVTRFLGRWLARAQDHGGRSPPLAAAGQYSDRTQSTVDALTRFAEGK